MEEDLREIFQRHSTDRGSLIPILQDIQVRLGYLPREAMSRTARFLNVPESTVYGVVTFYAQFYLTPQGRHKIKVCLGTACHVRAGGELMDVLEKRLGIGAGETTPDLEFTLERVACLGSCALAPVMVVDNRVYGAMTVAKVESLLDTLTGEYPARDTGEAPGDGRS